MSPDEPRGVFACKRRRGENTQSALLVHPERGAVQYRFIHSQIEDLFQRKVPEVQNIKQVIMLGSSLAMRRFDRAEHKNHFVNLGVLSCNLVLSRYFAFIMLSSPIIVIVRDGDEILNFLNCEKIIAYVYVIESII